MSFLGTLRRGARLSRRYSNRDRPSPPQSDDWAASGSSDASFFEGDNTRETSPTGFERSCADILRGRGWKCSLTAGSGDQGIDIIAEKAGTRVVIQCKLYSKPVSNKAVQEAYAGRRHADAQVAAVVSNAGYTPGARALAASTGVLLMHVSDLAKADDLWIVGRVHNPCPACKTVLRLPARRRGIVKCPKCGYRFEART